MPEPRREAILNRQGLDLGRQLRQSYAVATMVAILLWLPAWGQTPANLAASRSTAASAGAAADSMDMDMVYRIREEGFRNSHVMETLEELTDDIGPRLTNSPNARRANKWTRDQLAEWGMENAHLEPWGPFGRGWSYQLSSVRMTEPDTAELLALPKAWTPGTDGTVSGEPVRLIAETPADLEKWKGKVRGKIVLLGEARELKPHEKADLVRFDEKSLEELAQYPIPEPRPVDEREAIRKRLALAKALEAFFVLEKPAAVIEPSRSPGDDGTIFVQGGGSYKAGEDVGPPTLVMANEHFNRLSRLMEHGHQVKLQVEVKTKFYDDDMKGYNTIAEILGTDLKDQVVMLGAHLDSWHGGTGATDNAAGSAVAMEAMRILKALDIKPRRTIRIALWTGEEQGLLGSKAYVAQHFATRPETKDPKELSLPSWMRKPGVPLQRKPEWEKLSVYFNLDNGTGKIRGVYLQENPAVAAIFQRWMEPFRDLGMTTLTMRQERGTDHLSFDEAGLPGFQFIQDEIEYRTRTHHSNMDVFDRIQPQDMMQASVIMAAFVYQAAMRDQMFPRKPLSKADLGESAAAGGK